MNEKIKVLFLIKFPLFGGGSGNYTRKLAEKLILSDNIEVAIAAPDDRPMKKIKLFTLHPKRKAVFVSHPEYPRAKKYLELSNKEFTSIYISFFTQIIAIIEEYRPNVIHVNHCSFLSWIASYIKSIYGIPFIVTAHGTDVFQATVDSRFLSMTKQALARSEYILSNSNWTNKWLLKIFGRQLTRKTRILPCGVDLQSYPRDKEIKIINNKYNLEGKKVVIFVGRLTSEKGVEYLLKAANRIKGEIFIIGGGAEKENLEKIFNNLKNKNVHFLGYFGKDRIEELREFYKRADCVVVPSVCDEGLGIVVLEAMASETPVVATNKGGIPLAVKDGKTGFLVRARSGKVIADAVNKLLLNKKLRDQMGNNARKLIEERFDWIKISHRVLKYYSRAVKTGGKLRAKKLPLGIEPHDIEKEKIDLKKKIDFAP